MGKKKQSASQPETLSRSAANAVPLQRIRRRIIEELASREGILMVFTEAKDEESTIIVIMNREDFDEEVELQVYALQESLMEEFQFPLSFVCLPRIALQEGVPSTLAEVLVNRRT
ncbi:MAG: hypothetical protein ACREQ7_15995 [Candidatus Binatia bacterium]